MRNGVILVCNSVKEISPAAMAKVINLVGVIVYISGNYSVKNILPCSDGFN